MGLEPCNGSRTVHCVSQMRREGYVFNPRCLTVLSSVPLFSEISRTEVPWMCMFSPHVALLLDAGCKNCTELENIIDALKMERRPHGPKPSFLPLLLR